MSEWIAVAERLPDFPSGYVLVHCEGGMVDSDFYCENRDFLHRYGNRYTRKRQGKLSGYFRSAHEYGYTITHWMPLPAAPLPKKEPRHD